MKPSVVAALAVAVILGIGGIAFVASRDTASPTSSNPSSSDSDNTYTSGEVSAHNSKQDCWTIIDGSVYNLTDYVARHPGGSPILQACGIDGTTLFQERTTAEGEAVGSGTSHSNNAAAQLANLKIGTLN